MFLLLNLFIFLNKKSPNASVCRPKFHILFLAKMVNINYIRNKNSYFGTPKLIHCQSR